MMCFAALPSHELLLLGRTTDRTLLLYGRVRTFRDVSFVRELVGLRIAVDRFRFRHRTVLFRETGKIAYSAAPAGAAAGVAF